MTLGTSVLSCSGLRAGRAARLHVDLGAVSDPPSVFEARRTIVVEIEEEGAEPAA